MARGAAPTQSKLPLPIPTIPTQPISAYPARGSDRGSAIVVEAATRRALRLISDMDAETLVLWLQVGRPAALWGLSDANRTCMGSSPRCRGHSPASWHRDLIGVNCYGSVLRIAHSA